MHMQNFTFKYMSEVLVTDNLLDAFELGLVIAKKNGVLFGICENVSVGEKLAENNSNLMHGASETWDEFLGVLCLFEYLIKMGKTTFLNFSVNYWLSIVLKHRCEGRFETLEEREEFIKAIKDLIFNNFCQMNQLNNNVIWNEITSMSFTETGATVVFGNDLRLISYEAMKDDWNNKDRVEEFKFIEAKSIRTCVQYFNRLRLLTHDFSSTECEHFFKGIK